MKILSPGSATEPDSHSREPGDVVFFLLTTSWYWVLICYNSLAPDLIILRWVLTLSPYSIDALTSWVMGSWAHTTVPGSLLFFYNPLYLFHNPDYFRSFLGNRWWRWSQTVSKFQTRGHLCGKVPLGSREETHIHCLQSAVIYLGWNLPWQVPECFKMVTIPLCAAPRVWNTSLH